MDENMLCDRRVCERTEFSRKVKLIVNNQQRCECTTNDISLGGIQMSTSQAVPNIKTGQKAQLSFQDQEDSQNLFNCHVTRVDGQSISVEIDRSQAAAFGKALTKGMLKRK